VASVRGGYGHAPVTYQILEETMRTHLVTRKTFDTFREVLLEGVAKFVKEQVGAAAARGSWRAAEAERRISELEARLAKLEGRSDDR
jgi:BMFP domain-containing protein YqiC